MGIFDGILICSDLDGSLRGSLIPGEKICEKNRTAIQYFQENGGLFTIASGRYPDHILALRDLVYPNTALIALNGSKIVDPESGKTLSEHHVDETVFPVIDEVLAAFPYEAHFLFYPTDTEKTLDFSREEYYAEKDALKKRLAYKALLVTDTGEHGVILRDIAREKVKGTVYEAARSWPIGLEFINREGNKGNAVRWLKEKTKSSLLVTVGDYENDIPMLGAADIGYAVANATDEVKAAANRVTRATNAEGAIAEIIRDLEKELTA